MGHLQEDCARLELTAEVGQGHGLRDGPCAHAWEERARSLESFRTVPAGIALHEGKLWVADINNHRIQALDKDTGECVAAIGGKEEGKLRYPSGIAIAPTAGLVSSETWMDECERAPVASVAIFLSVNHVMLWFGCERFAFGMRDRRTISSGN